MTSVGGAIDRVGEARMGEATHLDHQVRVLAGEVGRSWVRLGQLCLRIRDGRLYEELGFRSFDDWMRDRLEESRSTVYATIRTVRELSSGMDPQEIGQLTKQNADLLTKLPESKRFQPEWRRAAKDQPAAAFKQMIESNLTPTEIDEPKKSLTFWLDVSAAKVVEQAIEEAKRQAETEQRGVALEMIAADFLSAHAVEAS